MEPECDLPMNLARPPAVSTVPPLRSIRPTSALIVGRNDIESPAPGRWIIPPQTVRAGFGATLIRRTCVTVRGELVIDERTSIELVTVPDGSQHHPTPDVHYRGVLVSSDRLGRWQFHGTATSGGIVFETTLRIDYHGVFRSGPHGVTWLAIAGADSNIGSHLKRDERRRLVRGLTGGLNAILDHPPALVPVLAG